MKHRKKSPLPPPKRLQLKPDHTWKAPPGYKVLVLDRGAVSFNIPENWLIHKMEPLELHNAPPPDDDARISVTFWKMPPGIDWSGLPIDRLLEQSVQGTEREILSKTPIKRLPRTDIEVVWTEHRFIDTVEPREAYTRITVARGFDIHILITMDYWVDDAARFRPVWEEVIRSLQLGRIINDPTRGETLH